MTEMEKLIDMLKAESIPHEITLCGGELQVCYPESGKNCVCDAVCHPYSYGYDQGLLEIMGLTENWDDVEGYLTAEEVFHRMKAHYTNS